MSAHMKLLRIFKNLQTICRIQAYKWLQPAETPLPALSAAALNPAGNLLAPEEDSLESWDGFLLAVPKKRTTNLKKKKRRWLSIHQNDNCTPKENIVECPKCGHWNESHTLCGFCYNKVREQTAQLKAKLEAEDSYFFNQTKPLEVKDVPAGVKTERERFLEEVTWFKGNLKQKP